MKIRPPKPHEQLGMMLLGYLVAGLVTSLVRLFDRSMAEIDEAAIYRCDEVFIDLRAIPPGYTQFQVDSYLHRYGRDTPGLN